MINKKINLKCPKCEHTFAIIVKSIDMLNHEVKHYKDKFKKLEDQICKLKSALSMYQVSTDKEEELFNDLFNCMK